MGNRGRIGAGDIQWMTAGSGIIHQEMPKGDGTGRMHGFQLWANLPSALKMAPPRYQEVKSLEDIPEVTDDDGSHVRIICGSFWGKPWAGRRHRGRSDFTWTSPFRRAGEESCRLRRLVMPSRTYSRETEKILQRIELPARGADEGIKWLDTAPPAEVDNRSLVVFDNGDELEVQAGETGIRFNCARFRQTAGGTGGMVRSHCDEHAGGAAPGVRRS